MQRRQDAGLRERRGFRRIRFGRPRRGGFHAQEGLRKVAHIHRFAANHHAEALDKVLQLPHVPRPGIPPEGVHGFRSKLLQRRSEPGRVELVETLDQERDVRRPLAQGRNVQGDHVQPVVEVRPVLPRIHPALEIHVRGGDQPDVERYVLRAAHRKHLALLQGAQQLDLEVAVQLADLVQQEAASGCGYQQAVLVLVGAGEGALHVPEEFALQQGAGEAAAVHCQEGPGRPAAVVVYRPRHQLLAGSALAGDDDGALLVGHDPHLFEELQHHFRLAHYLGEVEAGAHLPAQNPVLGEHLTDLKRPLQRNHELFDLERLYQIVAGTLPHGLHSAVYARIGRHDDPHQLGVEPAEFGQQIDPVHPRHAQIHQGDVRRSPGRMVQGLERRSEAVDLEALLGEQHAQPLQHGGLVVHYHEPELGRHSPAPFSGRSTVTESPPPSTAENETEPPCSSATRLAT
ncbi:MAG: hypothetical protein BWX47_02015 [candidate division Hyd24-12 bacterium ADurb.Bin004]|nr:MAG: hypothetical protein BWX47_02015 [candidate division Hyd24-12 bacterium ADurb.Bin004]